MLLNRHNNKYSYTSPSDDNLLKNLELFDKLVLRFNQRIKFIKGFRKIIYNCSETWRLFSGRRRQRSLLLDILRTPAQSRRSLLHINRIHHRQKTHKGHHRALAPRDNTAPIARCRSSSPRRASSKRRSTYCCTSRRRHPPPRRVATI